MKYSGYLLMVALCYSLISCKKEPAPLNPNYIPVNNCRSFSIGGKTLTLCLDSVIQDSRCPRNALCIWQGLAAGRFSASVEGENQVVTLATVKLTGYNNEAVVEGFKIEFIDLTPHAELNNPFSYNDYVAEVKVTKP